jgi:hypothetical protein
LGACSSNKDDTLVTILKNLYRKIRNFLHRIRDLFRRTKNPWDDIETSARLYRIRHEQTGFEETQSDETVNDLAKKIYLNPPQDFGQVARLVELITAKPLILTPLRCLQCGADLRLPSSGQYVQCNHCGYAYHVTNVTQMIEELLRR